MRSALPSVRYGLLLLLASGVASCDGESPTGSVASLAPEPALRSLAPAAVGAVRVRTLAVGTGGGVGIRYKDATVVGWGQSDFTPPSGLGTVVAVSSTDHYALALKANGTVVGWGQSNRLVPNTIPAGLKNVVAISAAPSHGLALKSDGTVVRWGVPAADTVPPGLAGVVDVAAGNGFSVALESDGTVVAWGDDSQGQTDVPAGLADVVAITAGYAHTAALRSDGTVVSWGVNGYGITNVPAGLTGVVAIAAGAFYTVALKSDGTVWRGAPTSKARPTCPRGSPAWWPSRRGPLRSTRWR
jgi:alpha-tubulin suppressor-like RCC1 family protein